MNPGNENSARDPLGLGKLPLVDPEQDGWPEIRSALQASAAPSRNWGRAGGLLAAAASLVLVVGLIMHQGSDGIPEPTGTVATNATDLASVEQDQTLNDLITMSQMLETRLRNLRDESGVIPGPSLLNVTELEDMIARVDRELNHQPDSVDLWGQRVNLMLDLELIFQHHWEREYGRMASR